MWFTACLAQLKPTYKWNAANRLFCQRSALNNNQTRYTIQQQESTWFSKNEHVLLGEILLVAVQTYGGGFGNKGCDVAVNFGIEIVEHGEDNFATDAPTKQLYFNSII